MILLECLIEGAKPMLIGGLITVALIALNDLVLRIRRGG